MRGMADNTTGPGGQPPEDYPRTVTDGSTATPSPPPPPAYTPTELYQPQVPQAPQPPQAPQTPPQTQVPPQQPAPQAGGPAYAPTQAYTPQGQPPPPQQQAAPTPPPHGGAGGGYGYPQAPAQPGPYPQQGGYPPPQAGYPQQQPGPYPQQVPPQQGFPPAYPQQQGYPPAQGYPQPTAYPQTGYGVPGYPVAPAPRRGVRKGAILGTIGGVLALAIIGTVIAVVNSGGSKGADANTLDSAWSVPTSGSDDELVGSWLTSTDVVRAGSSSGVSAYDLTTGHKTWTVTPPSDASKPCAMSPTVSSDGVGTVGFGTDAHSCKYIAGVDSDTGSILWKVDLTDTDDPVATTADTFVQGSVATILSLGRAGGFNTRTGKEIWLNPARGKYCNEDAFGTTGAVVVDDFCADASPERTLTALDPATGKRLWRKTESQAIVEGYFLNGSPIVALLSSNLKDPLSIYSSTGDAKQLDMSNFTLDNENPTSVKLSGQTLVAQSAEDLSDSSSTSGQVVAFDLSTGEQLWQYNGESKHGAVLVHTVSGSNLYALSTGTFEGSPHFVRLDPTTGKSTIIGALPSSTNDWFVGESVLYALPDGGLLTLGVGYQSTSAPAIALYAKSK